jgi:putative transcriptional regulator
MADFQRQAGLAPGMLVAAPTLRDPNFEGSLVLMAQHSSEGALGFVVNRPAPLPARAVLEAVDPALRAAAQQAGRDGPPVLLGGPVQVERLWILWRPGKVPAGDDDLAVSGGLALGGSRDLLDSVARDPGAGPYQLILGYAGWGPMQVENEVAAGAWIPLALQDDLVFEVPFEVRWEEAVRRLGLDPEGFNMGGGGAQA